MERVYIKDVSGKIGEKILLKGFVHIILYVIMGK